MNRMLDKLRSGRGASITFALLLFLVCAVLCSVIITTASTAAGRMSNMAEADQRYYSVTSACELMKGLIDGKTVTMVKASDTTYLVPGMGGEQASVSYNDNTGYKLPNTATVNQSIVTYTANARYNNGNKNGTFTNEKVTLSGLSDDLKDGAAPKDLLVTLGNNGDITLTVTKTSGRNQNPFAMEMVFTADVKNGSFSKRVNPEEDPIQITTTTYTWWFKSAKVLSATGAGV